MLTTLAGCQHTPAPEEEIPILFGVYSGVEVKSFEAPHGSDYLIKAGNKAQVFGTWTSATEASSEHVFEGVTLTCGSGLTWTYPEEDTRFWKRNGSYHFKAVFPIPEEVGYSTNGIHLTVPYSMHTGNTDLMVASVARDMATGNLNSVNLDFHHTTAAVRFLFRKGDAVEDTYFLDLFEIQNVYTVGELILETDTIEEDTWTDSWYLATNYRPDSVFLWEADGDSEKEEDHPIPIPATYGAYTGYTWYYCLPQALAVESSEAHPAIHFRVSMSNGVSIENTLEIPETDASNDPITWEAGKAYTYKVSVTPQTTTVTVQVNPWDASYVSVDELIFD